MHFRENASNITPVPGNGDLANIKIEFVHYGKASFV